MDYNIFIREWIRRAERKEGEPIDKADKFISLWIAFNGWLKKEFGENEYDCTLMDSVKNKQDFVDAFDHLKEGNSTFQAKLEELSRYYVIDMRQPNKTNNAKNYDGTFNSFIDVIYQIRCNLFHGRKSVDENDVDRYLVTLAFDLLYPLFKKYITERVYPYE